MQSRKTQPIALGLSIAGSIRAGSTGSRPQRVKVESAWRRRAGALEASALGSFQAGPPRAAGPGCQPAGRSSRPGTPGRRRSAESPPSARQVPPAAARSSRPGTPGRSTRPHAARPVCRPSRSTTPAPLDPTADRRMSGRMTSAHDRALDRRQHSGQLSRHAT